MQSDRTPCAPRSPFPQRLGEATAASDLITDTLIRIWLPFCSVSPWAASTPGGIDGEKADRPSSTVPSMRGFSPGSRPTLSVRGGGAVGGRRKRDGGSKILHKPPQTSAPSHCGIQRRGNLYFPQTLQWRHLTYLALCLQSIFCSFRTPLKKKNNDTASLLIPPPRSPR